MLAERGHTAAEVERVLGLSPGYLSKVRHGAVRPSPQLVALLEVLRVHPETFDTVRASTRRAQGPAARPSRAAYRAHGARAIDALGDLEPALSRANVRWALAGLTGLRAHGVDLPSDAGVDIVVRDEDRHVLRVLRDDGHGVAHHASTLSICLIGASDPNEAIRVHFPETPPLSTALDHTVRLEVGGRLLPVVDGAVLTLAHLLSRREGSERIARAALSAGLASVASLRRSLDALDRLPATHSPSVLRVFDRALARSRLQGLRAR